MSGKTGWEPNISSFGSIISHLIIRPLRLLYHPYLSLLSFGRAPYAEPCGFPLPPPSPPLRPRLLPLNEDFFPNVYQHDTLKLTGCFTLIIHLLDVPKLWREVTRKSVRGRSISQALATNLAGKKVFLTRYIRSQNPPDELLEETQYKMVRVK